MSNLFNEALERLKRATNKEEFESACLGKWGNFPPSMSVDEFSRIIHSVRERIFELNPSYEKEIKKRQGINKQRMKKRVKEAQIQTKKRINEELKKHSTKPSQS